MSCRNIRRNFYAPLNHHRRHHPKHVIDDAASSTSCTLCTPMCRRQTKFVIARSILAGLQRTGAALVLSCNAREWYRNGLCYTADMSVEMKNDIEPPNSQNQSAVDLCTATASDIQTPSALQLFDTFKRQLSSDAVTAQWAPHQSRLQSKVTRGLSATLSFHRTYTSTGLSAVLSMNFMVRT